MTPPAMKSWLITGSRRGIGLEHVRQALAAGDTVIAACRDPARADALAALREAHPERLRLEALDVATPRRCRRWPVGWRERPSTCC